MEPLGLHIVPGSSSLGAVNGEAANLAYTCAPEHSLSWKLENSSAPRKTIFASDIIALYPQHAQTQYDYSLLHVEVRWPAGTTASDDGQQPSAAPYTYFKFTLLTRPPEDLVRDFAPSGASCFQLMTAGKSGATQTAAMGHKQTHAVHVIVSIASGQRHAEAVFENLLKPMLHQLDCTDYVLHVTESAQAVTDLGRNVFLSAAKRGIAKFIIMLSGDGGVVDLVNALIQETEKVYNAAHQSTRDANALTGGVTGFARPSLALLPLGTGNALANSSNITGDRTLGLSSVLRGDVAPLPMFRVHFDPPATPAVPSSSLLGIDSSPITYGEPVSVAYGAVVVSWALHAALVADSDAPEYREHGASRFQIAAKENLFPADGGPAHAYKGQLAVRRSGGGSAGEWGAIPRSRHSYVLATLCSQLEAGFTISPASRLLPGALWIVHMGPNDGDETMASDQIMGIMQAAYDGGKHVHSPLVGYEEIDSMRLVLEEENQPKSATGGQGRYRRICVDGKIYVCEAGTIITVEALGKEASVVDLVARRRQLIA